MSPMKISNLPIALLVSRKNHLRYSPRSVKLPAPNLSLPQIQNHLLEQKSRAQSMRKFKYSKGNWPKSRSWSDILRLKTCNSKIEWQH